MSVASWLLLLHHIPPKPAYFRAKVLRRLVQVGALPVKNSAYLLPDREDTLEDFEWISQEIRQEGGAVWLFRAETLVGMSASQIEEEFNKLRAPEYEQLIHLARSLCEAGRLASDEAQAEYRTLSRRMQELRRIDFFDSPARRELEDIMSKIEREIHAGEKPPEPGFTGKTWVTRKGVKVDRIGSAWLIRRFIDPEAAFRFVDPDNYSHSPPDIRFDMFEGEFTHRGEMCTFEVLIAVNNLTSNPALVAIGEIVHDIDLKQDRFQRPETAGIGRTIEGLCLQTPADDLRLERGSMIFEGLYQSFGGKGPC